MQHKIIPVIDSVFPFAEAKQVWQRFNSRQNVGKVVISH
ncbi:zinc-binding dehydrogenase [Yersinia rochesterensis]|nr:MULTISPECIES: zinc-binding dehydrogenase [Yersinia]